MNYKIYFALENKLKSQVPYDGDVPLRRYLVSTYTEGEKDSLKALNAKEYKAFLGWLTRRFNLSNETSWQKTPANKMRRKVWGLLENMGYNNDAKDDWIIKYGKFHKPLNRHTFGELKLLVTQVQKMYQSHIAEARKSINNN